jgi:hypothetical protein
MAPFFADKEGEATSRPIPSQTSDPMSFKQLSQPDHLEHVRSIWPQIVIIWSIWITCQKQALFHLPSP